MEIREPRRAHSTREPTVRPLQVPSPTALRDELEQLVLLDLPGPAGGPEEEIGENSVRDRYLFGLLAPSHQQIKPEEQEELALAEANGAEEGETDATPFNTLTFRSSLIGMSFCVDGEEQNLAVTASWGRYRQVHSQTMTTAAGAPATVWKRQPMGGTSHLLRLQEGPVSAWPSARDEQPEVMVKGKIRRAGLTWTVTLFLVNGQKEPERRRDEVWLFQPELRVEAQHGSQRPIFCQRSLPRRYQPSDEELTMSMLYRQHANFAIGYGVGTHTTVAPGDQGTGPVACRATGTPSAPTRHRLQTMDRDTARPPGWSSRRTDALPACCGPGTCSL